MQYVSFSVRLISLCIISSILIHNLIESKIDIFIMEYSMKFLKKIKNRTAIWSSNPTVWKESHIRVSERYLQPRAHYSIIHKNQYMEIIINLWVKNEEYVT